VKKKNFYLTLALVVPVLVFVFLKFFGRNKFEIPIFHQSQIEEITDCNYQFDAPYLVPDSTIQSLGCRLGETILVVFINLQGENKLRIEEESAANRFKIVDLTDSSLINFNKEMLSCVLIKPPATNAVLIDSKKQIRGYYALDNREEMDRLQVELKILFNEYE
jgi:hypothetical protein